MSYVTVGDKARNASISLFIIGVIIGSILTFIVAVQVRMLIGIDTLEVKIYKDIQSKNDNKIPLGMKDGYDIWLKNIKVKQLEKEIKEGTK
ncbi:MAG: hypothetical protein CL624_05750 [Arcobacter sp.]|nr:hypothetical protein [Arcobacter sp.]|tara:strand:+ start:2009 stop:2281 length:273 start_codon:yes stop_codon:yes gene_type:complete